MPSSIKSTAVFLQPFELASFDETLPAGEYDIETELLEPVDRIEPGTWTESVLVRLHPRDSHPGLNRTLTVPLSELARVVAKDKLTGKALTDFFLEEMLADPMIHLVMQADGVAEAEVRHLHRDRSGERTAPDRTRQGLVAPSEEDDEPARERRRASSRAGIGE